MNTTVFRTIVCRCVLCLTFLCLIAACWVEAEPPRLYAQTAQNTQTVPNATAQEYTKRASKAMNAQNFVEALEYWNKALQLTPQDPNAYSGRGQTRFYLRQYEAALEDFTKAMSLTSNVPFRATMLMLKGSAYTNMQRFQEALKEFTNALKLNPNNLGALMNRGVVRGILGDNRGAIDDLSKAIAINPAFTQLYFERGNLRGKERDFKGAIADYTIAIKQNPRYTEAYLNRGAARYEIGDNKGVVEDFTKVLEINPSYVQGYYNRGTARMMTKDYKGAVEDFDMALRLDPSRTSTLLNRASAKSLMNDYKGGIEDLTALLNANFYDFNAMSNSTSLIHIQQNAKKFDNAIAYYNRGGLRLAVEDVEGACKDFRRAAELGSQEAAVPLEKHCTTPRSFEPEPSFPEHLQLYPRDAQDSAVMRLGGVLSAAGYDSAVAEIRKNGVLWKRLATPLVYASGKAVFALQPKLHAELAEYTVTLRATSNASNRDTVLAVRDSIVCGDVILASGQSNIVLGSAWDAPQAEYLRTYTYNHTDGFWQRANGSKANAPDTVGGRYSAGAVGAVAYRIQEYLANEFRVPVCVINGGMGASTTQQHQADRMNPVNPATLYGRMLLRVQKAGLAEAARVMVWYQGESNTAEDYTNEMIRLHQAWHVSYPNLRKVYVVQIRPSFCAQKDQEQVRELQRRFQQMFTDVEVVASAALPAHDGCHYDTEGYKVLGSNLARLIGRDFYGTPDDGNLSSPMIAKAVLNNEKTELTLTFAPANTQLVAGADTTLSGTTHKLHEYFYANVSGTETTAKSPVFSSVKVQGNTLVLRLAQPVDVRDVSYLPSVGYAVPPNDNPLYVGPWLTNKRGVGALAFYKFPVER